MNERIKQIDATLAGLALEVKPLAEKSAASALSTEEDTRFDDLVNQINTAKADRAAAVTQFEQSKAVLELNEQYNTPITQRDALAMSLDTASEPGTKRAYQSPGSALVNSEAYKQALKNGTGVTKYSPVELPGFFGPEAEKALIQSATGTASFLLPQVLPGIYRGLERPLTIRDVLLNLNTTSDAITVLQEGVYTNSAAEVAEATLVSNGAKPESGFTFTEATFPVQTIAHWLPVTRQVLEDLAFMEGYINERLLTGLRRRENAQFLNGNGTAPNLRGILQTSGIQNLDQTYFTANPVKNAASDNENLNRIRRGIRVIQVTGLASPTFIVMNPVDAEAIDTSTDANRQYIFGGPTSGIAARTLWGLRVVEDDNMAAGGVLMGDGNAAAVVDRNQARVYTTDSHSDFFIRNIITVLAEERVCLPIFRPAAFAFIDLA